MGIGYAEGKLLHDKLDAIAAAQARIEVKVNGLAALDLEVVRLSAENEELKASIAAAVDSTDAVERAAQAGLPLA